MKNESDEGGRPRPGRPRQFDRKAALEAALKLFWEQGYVQTTTANLCKRMGINSPSLYCAFGSKSRLFLEALAYYRERYWTGEFSRFMSEPDLYTATKNLFERAAFILLAPEAPCGCMTVQSAMMLPHSEAEIRRVISDMREDTRKMFRNRLQMAARAGQIPVDCDIPAYAGALTNFFEGLSLQASGDICLAELRAIALTGLRLLPIPGVCERS